MLATWRWFGPDDPVTLAHVRQAGANGIVTALHDIPAGREWSVDAIRTRKKLIEDAGRDGHSLHWAVVESVPLHTSIQTGAADRDRYIEIYRQTLRNLNACGISTVCYNFMPVLDWSRTDLDYAMPDGSTALRYESTAMAAFDVHILKRPGADTDYDEETLRAAADFFLAMDSVARDRLTETVLWGLPGSDKSYTLGEFASAIAEFRDVGAEELQGNLQYFHSKVVPLAEELGMRLAIHPDDPPFPILGMPRVVSTAEDFDAMFSANSAAANGLTLCVGSLGSRPDNDVAQILADNAGRIHFAHLRNVRHQGTRSFYESDHLVGDVDMYEIVRGILAEEDRRRREGRTDSVIPMRPDHGHHLLDDLHRKTNPGYSLIGRLRGLAELRGLELGIRGS